MKKNQLKNSLGRIRPREELIRDTILKVEAQKIQGRETRTLLSPVFSKGIRIAGAFCALALAVGIGFALAGNDKPVTVEPPTRTLAEIETNECTGADYASFTFEEETPSGWIIVTGNADSLAFIEPSDEEKAAGYTKKAEITFSADKMLEKSASIEVDLDKVSTSLTLTVCFEDDEEATGFSNLTTGELILRITPKADGSWYVVEAGAFLE